MTSLVVIARRLSFIRETEPNQGAWVEMLQRFTGGQPGDSWCADFLSFVEDIAFFGKSPSTRTGSCQVKLLQARDRKWIVTQPQTDDIYFYITDLGVAHHCGIVTTIQNNGIVIGIAGNTSSDGKSSNGFGVFEHGLQANNIVFVRLPR